VSWDQGGSLTGGGITLGNVAVGLSGSPMAGVVQAALARTDARMAQFQATNDALAAELSTVRTRLAEVESLNTRLLSLAAAVEGLKAELNQAAFSRIARGDILR
jgi:Tfp pilus assembly protein PilN